MTPTVYGYCVKRLEMVPLVFGEDLFAPRIPVEKDECRTSSMFMIGNPCISEV